MANISIAKENLMKKLFTIAALSITMALTACSRVEPNQAGVLMQDYGRNGKSDFSIVSGRVWTASPGTELYTVPLFEQRGQFEEIVTLKSSDGTEFVVRPVYTFKVIKDRAVDVIFDNKQIMGDENAIQSIRINILDPKITDLLRTLVLSKRSTDLMAEGGNEKFNEEARKLVTDEFKRRGFEIVSFSAMLDYSAKVKTIIDARNQSNTQVSTLDSKIEQARKELELEQINTQIAKVKSDGLTDAILKEKFIEKWDGKTPLYGNTPVTNLVK